MKQYSKQRVTSKNDEGLVVSNQRTALQEVNREYDSGVVGGRGVPPMSSTDNPIAKPSRSPSSRPSLSIAGPSASPSVSRSFSPSSNPTKDPAAMNMSLADAAHDNTTSLHIPGWLHYNSNVTIALKRGRRDRLGSRMHAVFQLSTFADCYGYNFCVLHNSGQPYMHEMNIPICPQKFPPGMEQFHFNKKEEIDKPGVYLGGDPGVTSSVGNKSCLYSKPFRSYWKDRIIQSRQRGAFKDSEVANERLFAEKGNDTAIAAVHVRRGDIRNDNRRDIFKYDKVVIAAITEIRTLVEKRGKKPQVHLFSEDYGTTNWTAYGKLIDNWHLAPQMNSDFKGHQMDWALNLRDWYHFLEADILVTDGSFSSVPGYMRDDVNPATGFPLTFTYCVPGSKRHYNCDGFPHHNKGRIAYKMNPFELELRVNTTR